MFFPLLRLLLIVDQMWVKYWRFLQSWKKLALKLFSNDKNDLFFFLNQRPKLLILCIKFRTRVQPSKAFFECNKYIICNFSSHFSNFIALVTVCHYIFYYFQKVMKHKSLMDVFSCLNTNIIIELFCKIPLNSSWLDIWLKIPAE